MHICPGQKELCADAFLLGVSFTESRCTAAYSGTQPVTQLSFVAQHDLILAAQSNKSDAAAALSVAHSTAKCISDLQHVTPFHCTIQAMPLPPTLFTDAVSSHNKLPDSSQPIFSSTATQRRTASPACVISGEVSWP